MSALQEPGNNSMATLMYCNNFSFLLWHQALSLDSTKNPLCWHFEINCIDRLLSISGCEYSRLVADIGNLRPTKSWSQCGQPFSVVVFGFLWVELDWSKMDIENLFSSFQIRKGYLDASIEPTRSCEGRVQQFLSICGGHYNDFTVGSKSIHLNE